MDDRDFKDFYQRYSKLNFSSDKKAFIEHAMLTTNFSVNQCLSLLEALSFSSDKKELIKNIYPNISDKQNFYRILDSFTFQSDKNEIDDYIREHYYRWSSHFCFLVNSSVIWVNSSISIKHHRLFLFLRLSSQNQLYLNINLHNNTMKNLSGIIGNFQITETLAEPKPLGTCLLNDI